MREVIVRPLLLLALFNACHVEYLIVGGYALASHGAPRFTGDLDIFVNDAKDTCMTLEEIKKEE
jgi:hypothetical protein